MDFFFDPEQLKLRHNIRSWVEKNLLSAKRREAKSDTDEEAKRLVGLLGLQGFIRYVVPKKFGGVRDTVQARDLCILREELSRGQFLSDTMFAMQALGGSPITLAGSDQQKARYLPPIARGEAIAAFALTEPQAGSDVSSMETRATKRGNEYRITGVKCFISNAGLAHTYVVFALTDPKKRAKGVSAFVVEADTPGFSIKERTPLLSPHPIGTISLDDCRVAKSQLLGREGEGMKIALTTLDTLRCTVGAAAVGLGQRALEEAVRYSKSRHQFGRALAQFQATQFKVADMATELEASRLLVYQAAWTIDRGQGSPGQKSSMAKLFATEAAQRIIDQALQIHGGLGVVVGSATEQLYRDVRALRIYEGTSEIQRIIIARTLFANNKK
jgi:acyl-CoA dehydrogenase